MYTFAWTRDVPNLCISSWGKKRENDLPDRDHKNWNGTGRGETEGGGEIGGSW